MWPRWRRLASRGGGNESPSFAKSNNPSFAFKDLRSLVLDDDKDESSADRGTPASSSASTSPAAVFRRVRVASTAVRAWRSSSTDLSSEASAAALSSSSDKRIVVYYTSLRVVRKTFEDCRAVRSILRGFRVVIDERDLSMDSGFLSELKQLLGKKQQQSLSLPRVFIGGRYVGGFEEIQQLHESGELKKFVDGAPPAAVGACEVCGGMRFILCQTCSGSHKYYSEKKGFRSCTACNENGLVRCPDCCAGD